MTAGRLENKASRQEGTLLRPPEPKASRSNRALPIFNDILRCSGNGGRFPDFGGRILTVAGMDYANAVISDHAASQLQRRGISVALLAGVLRDPEQVLEVRLGRVILQSRVQIGTSQQLIRVFVDVDVSPAQVVTANRSSKIDNYWSK